MEDRWLICGGRAFADQGLFDRVMRTLMADRGPPDVVINGKATGADRMASAWADRFGIEKIEEEAKWKDLSHPDAIIKTHPATKEKYDAQAGPRRNGLMLELHKPTLTIGFPGKFGTVDMLIRSMRANIETLIITDSGLITTVAKFAK